jgi:hypothetical protein
MAALPLKVGPNTVQGLEWYANDNTKDPGLRGKHLEVLIEQDVSLEYIDDGQATAENLTQRGEPAIVVDKFRRIMRQREAEAILRRDFYALRRDRLSFDRLVDKEARDHQFWKRGDGSTRYSYQKISDEALALITGLTPSAELPFYTDVTYEGNSFNPERGYWLPGEKQARIIAENRPNPTAPRSTSSQVPGFHKHYLTTCSGTLGNLGTRVTILCRARLYEDALKLLQNCLGMRANSRGIGDMDPGHRAAYMAVAKGIVIIRLSIVEGQNVGGITIDDTTFVTTRIPPPAGGPGGRRKTHRKNGRKRRHTKKLI